MIEEPNDGDVEPPPPDPPPPDPPPPDPPPPDPAPNALATPSPTASPPVYGARRLIGASFDVLGRASDEMRRASFYIGLVALGTVGPLAMGAWWLGLRSIHMTVSETDSMLTRPIALWINLLAWPAVIGVIVLSVEGRAMAAAILGARVVERPLTVRQALARSRSVFWRVIGASIVSAIPIGLIQLAVEEFANSVLPVPGQASLPISLIVTAVVGGPLAYIASGVVLGDVGPVEAVRRSINVFRARKIAAMVVALFETIAALLIVFGVSAGLDLALRIFGTLGLGTDSGPVGIVLVTVGVAAATFALGTLIYTVSAIAIAPQVVMFVGLTHATMGLDHVRLGGRHDPDAQRPGVRGFRVFTRLMLFGIGVAWVGLVGLALQLRA